jgi:NADH-quinone oxidoreductase subunit N
LPYTITLKIVLACVSVFSILGSALAAVRQDCMKKIMAYSMSVHSGVILLGLCVFSVYSLSSVLFYLFCYVIVCLGVWSAITIVYNSAKSSDISMLNGLLYHRPYFVMAFTFILIALAGLAPTCGFVAKLYIFSAVARSGMFYLPFLLIAFLGLVVMVYSYWRIIRGMFRRIETDIEIDNQVLSSKILLYASSIATVVLGVFVDKFIQLCQLVAYYM